MQVSWIDADRLKALVAQIMPQEPCEDEAPQAVEIETVPDAVSMSAIEYWSAAMDWMEPATAPLPAAEVIETEPAEPEQECEEPPEILADSQEDILEDDDDHGMPLHNPAAALPLSRIRDKLRAIRQRATEAGILTRVSDAAPPSAPEASMQAPIDVSPPVVSEPAAPAPQTPIFEIPLGSRDERLAAFAAWARQVLHEDGGHVLVMSDDGEVLWGGEAKAGLVLSTMMAWGAATRASAMSACGTPLVIRQPLASGNVLTVIPCETAAGTIHAAIAAPAAVSEDIATLLRGALCATMA